jgi:hypothetical protein
MSVPAADLPTPQPLSLLPSKPGQALQHGSSRQGTEIAACSGIASSLRIAIFEPEFVFAMV